MVQFQAQFQKKQSDLQASLASAMYVEPEHLELNSEEKEAVAVIEQKAKDLDTLMYLLKETLQFSSKNEKTKILTLVPDSWSDEK